MKENPLLALLAKLCGDITLANNPDANQLFQLQQSLATAIINDPTPPVSRFQFERLENFSTHHLDATDLEHLNNVLQNVGETHAHIDTTVRVFKREVPFISSRLPGSVPGWAWGARILQTIGPFINRDGRKVWFDFYKIIPVAQVWLQGAPQPFLLVPIEVSSGIRIIGPRHYKIPKGSVWIHADVFAPPSPDNLYCGLTVNDGTIDLSGPLAIDETNKLVLPVGMEASVKLNLAPKQVADESPDDQGIDVKEANIELPQTLSFTINHTGRAITVDAAQWNLYGQKINFSFDNTKPARWSAELNRIVIPFKTDVTEMQVLQCKSAVCAINGKAPIAEAAWLLNAAAININAPLEADGTGAMGVAVVEGLEASWYGLKDAHLLEPGKALLKNAWVMLMPGRINISTLFASNATGRQRYILWQEPAVEGVEKPVQHIDLFYTKRFFFFYDNLQKGTETVAAQANCISSVDKPVKADGSAFKVESLQTIFVLSINKALQIAMLYDDNIIADNWIKTYKPVPGVAAPPISFETTAIALNNALLTVSPVYSMLLYGDLKTENSFEKCLLVFSFGMLQYLPTLPDPYAANVSLLKRRPLRGANQEEPDKHVLSEINALLVCLMNWKEMDAPAINFFLGDKPATTQLPPGNDLTGARTTSVRLDVLKNGEILDSYQRAIISRSAQLQTRSWQGVTNNAEESSRMVETQNAMIMAANQSFVGNRASPFSNAFTLLDVSTNADLLGVSLGFANDDFIFRKTHMPKNEIGNPITINGLDVQAASRLVQIYALPQISWEPMINLSEVSNPAQDPYPGVLYFLNDGVPAQIANTGSTPVPLAPIPLTKQITEQYTKNNVPLWSYFTLSNGMLALAMYIKNGDNSPSVELIEQTFKGDIKTGLQIKTVGFYDNINKHKKFLGSAHQLENINNLFFPATNGRSVLSGSVTEIFNREFGQLGSLDPEFYVPLERYDFSGYGANVFSHWVNQNAALAQTSQAMFDVWRGRSAHEVIQVKSVIYPWGIRVVRTITIYRGSNGFPWRTDSGWKAESDGIYDFRTPVKIITDPPADPPALINAKNAEAARTYVFHPGMVEGVYNVRNIKEDATLSPYTNKWNKTVGVYIDKQGHPQPAPSPDGPLDVKLVPVYFDADVQIDDVTQGASNGKVLSQRMLGYLQLAPKGVFIDAEHFAELLTKMQGLGGPVDCMLNINQSNQLMRVARVEVNPGMDAANKRVFVVAAKGTPILPKDGSWSVVEHNAATKEVLPLSGNNSVPLIRQGLRVFPDLGKLNYTQDKAQAVNVAEATELFKNLEARAKQYGFLQSTGENKVLFRNPFFEKGADKDILKSSVPDLADAYHLMNSKGIFPKLEDLPSIDKIGTDYVMKIKEEGYKLLNKLDPAKLLEQKLEGDWYIVKTNDVKVYIRYKSKDEGGAPKDSFLNLDIDSTAQKWLNKMNDVSMFVDLGSFKELLVIRGKFDTKKGEAPKFIEPILEFGPQLKPVYEILLLLSQLSIKPSYKDLLKKGLKIAMSNSPNNWEYKFQADKEIPVLRFPPPELDTAAAPLRLEASLKAGVYFNVALPMPPTNGVQAPGAGAFVEFFGKMSVMCVSVGVGSIYAVGQATVRISADTVTGPALYMKFGFGVEAVVALPVIGSVSVYFAVGVEMSLDSTQITIGGFVLFRGRAEILGGIVTVTIQIEASGKVQDRIGGDGGETNMIAQVIFSLDISICFIIDISFTEQWQEQRQIA